MIRRAWLSGLIVAGLGLAVAPEAWAQPADAPAAEAPAPAGPVEEEAAPVEVAPAPTAAPTGPPPGLTKGELKAWEAGQLVDEGQLAAAEAKAASAMTASGGKAAGHYQVARIRLREGKIDQATTEARLAVDADPTFSPAQLLLVRLLALRGQARDAVGALEGLVRKEPDALGLKAALAEAYLGAGRTVDALETARSVLKKSETSVVALKLLARAYMANGNDSAGEAILGRALEIEPDAEAYMLRGGIEVRRDKVVNAKAWFEKAVAADGQHVEALTNLGWTYLKVRNFAAARDVLERATRLAPGYATAWLNVASAYRGLKQFEDAERTWKKVLELDPKLSEASYNLGVLYLENPLPGRDREAQLGWAIDRFNDFKKAGRPTAEQLGQVDKFIDVARRLIEQEKQRKAEELKQPADEPVEEGLDDEGDGTGEDSVDEEPVDDEAVDEGDVEETPDEGGDGGTP